MEHPFGGLEPRSAAPCRFARFDGQCRRGNVAWREDVPARRRGHDDGRRQPADDHRIAIEQPAQLFAGDPGDVPFTAVRQQAPRETGDERVAGGMRMRDPRLLADAGGEAPGDQRDDQQDGDGDDVGDPVDAQGVDRLGEEEIVGQRRGHAGEQPRAKAP